MIPPPAGYTANTPTEMEAMEQATRKAFAAIGTFADGMAIVYALPDGRVTAGFCSISESALELLKEHAADALKMTVKRLRLGGGKTIVE